MAEKSGRIVRVVHPRARLRWEPLSSAPSDLSVEISPGIEPQSVFVLSLIDPDGETHVVFVDDTARRALVAKMTGVQVP